MKRLTDLKSLFAGENRKWCNNTETVLLRIDEACLHLESSADERVSLWAQSAECVECDLLKYHDISPGGHEALVVNTSFPTVISLQSGTGYSCNKTYHFGEYGVYSLNFTSSSCSEVIVNEEPSNTILPILSLIVIFVFLGIFWIGGKGLYHKGFFRKLFPEDPHHVELESDLGSPSASESGPFIRSEVVLRRRKKKSRVKSLDVFRGLCISIMIFVNFGGGHYWFFQHSKWNGLTVADLVFPWFMWIMGISITISLRSHLRSSVTRKTLIWKVAKRSLLLIVLGIILNTKNGHNDVRKLRIPGVLQRFGVAYFIVATLEALLLKPQAPFQYGWWTFLEDILSAWIQWVVMLVLVIIHTTLTFLLPVPGCPTGYLGPGGLHLHGLYRNCTGGAAGYIDHLIFGENHIYKTPSFRTVYYTETTYDPEGLLGTLTSIFAVFLGVQAGRILVTYNQWKSRALRWMVWSVATGLIAGILCNFSKDDGVIPVNKNLWSLSFVLTLSSMAYLLLTVLFFVIDIKHWWSGSPFFYAGMNAIVLYIGQEITKNMFPWSWKPTPQTHMGFITMNVCGTALWMLIAFILYRRNVFLTL